MVSISDCHIIRHRDGGWRGVVSISNCHMIRHRDGGWRGVVSIVTLLDIEMGVEGCGFYLQLSHD